MLNRWSHILPALGVGALLSLELLQPSPRGAAQASSPLGGPNCTIQFEQTNGPSLFALNEYLFVEQPLPAIGNIAACSLGMPRPAYNFATMDIVQWDPNTLSPDPTTAALRTRAFNASELDYNHARADFLNPVVVRTIPGVAEPPRSTVAMQFRQIYSYGNISVQYDPAGQSTYPTAFQVTSTRTPLPGSHPVLSVGLCGGDAGTQGFRVVQSVMTTDFVIDTATYEIAQRFRVPAATTVRWVELAGGSGPYRGPYLENGNIAVYEGQNMPTPTTQLPAPMVEAKMSTAYFAPYAQPSVWFTHFAFDHTIALLPDHDYWIIARGDHDYSFRMRNLNGAESADFTRGIGPVHRRTDPNDPFTPIANKALSFRLIGEPILPVVVSPITPRGAALRLGASPNPAHGPVMLSWSGAKDGLAIDVLDARGRRVDHAELETAGAGRWLFRGVGSDGRPLPSGLYFVRATDRSDQRALERVVLVR
ncbi:MAG: hypothetical protein ABIU54_09345 [Candidatus Eisenbacteria bacterium]